MSRPASCEARAERDGCIRCAKCGTSWDADDADRPACQPAGRAWPFKVTPAVAAMPDAGPRRLTARVEARVPVELPDDLADRMAAAYDARSMGFLDEESAATTSRAAMRAAWRVFLDSLD